MNAKRYITFSFVGYFLKETTVTCFPEMKDQADSLFCAYPELLYGRIHGWDCTKSH
jgi:hypothetical protein